MTNFSCKMCVFASNKKLSLAFVSDSGALVTKSQAPVLASQPRWRLPLSKGCICVTRAKILIMSRPRLTRPLVLLMHRSQLLSHKSQASMCVPQSLGPPAHCLMGFHKHASFLSPEKLAPSSSVTELNVASPRRRWQPARGHLSDARPRCHQLRVVDACHAYITSAQTDFGHTVVCSCLLLSLLNWLNFLLVL